jgi:hypothetical protein
MWRYITQYSSGCWGGDESGRVIDPFIPKEFSIQNLGMAQPSG